MPIIDVSIAAGRPTEMVEHFVREIIDTASRTLEAPKENISVIVHEIPHTHIAVGGKLKSDS